MKFPQPANNKLNTAKASAKLRSFSQFVRMYSIRTLHVSLSD